MVSRYDGGVVSCSCGRWGMWTVRGRREWARDSQLWGYHGRSPPTDQTDQSTNIWLRRHAPRSRALENARPPTRAHEIASFTAIRGGMTNITVWSALTGWQNGIWSVNTVSIGGI